MDLTSRPVKVQLYTSNPRSTQGRGVVSNDLLWWYSIHDVETIYLLLKVPVHRTLTWRHRTWLRSHSIPGSRINCLVCVEDILQSMSEKARENRETEKAKAEPKFGETMRLVIMLPTVQSGCILVPLWLSDNSPTWYTGSYINTVNRERLYNGYATSSVWSSSDTTSGNYSRYTVIDRCFCRAVQYNNFAATLLLQLRPIATGCAPAMKDRQWDGN